VMTRSPPTVPLRVAQDAGDAERPEPVGAGR
jgi:hypothetical protein